VKTNLAIPQLVLLCVAVLIGTLPLLGHDKAADQASYDAIVRFDGPYRANVILRRAHGRACAGSSEPRR
jgi:hypothetical protein